MLQTTLTLAGRALLAFLFISAGGLKVANAQPFVAHMAEQGLPAALLPLVIAVELGAGLGVLLAWQLAYTAGALAVFCLATACIFHRDFSQKTERTLFAKDLALAGALMMVAAAV
jgi:putative oxidoreductase